VLVVDTGVIVAAADRTDRHHRDSAAVIRDEAAYLIERELGTAAEASLYDSIIEGDLTVETLRPQDWARIRELVETYADLALGGTDASLVAIAERLGVTRVATIDTTHFRVVRPTHCEAFELIP
jgi:predicted nucleic acid-binding protein